MVTGFSAWIIALWILPGEGSVGDDSSFTSILLSIPAMLWGFMASILGMVIGTLLGSNLILRRRNRILSEKTA
jgi:hypothetical protein